MYYNNVIEISIQYVWYYRNTIKHYNKICIVLLKTNFILQYNMNCYITIHSYYNKHVWCNYNTITHYNSIRMILL